MKASESYKKAGVDTAEGRRFAERIQKSVKSTHSPEVIHLKGGFAGLLDVSILKQYDDPVLVSTTDGVGTKLQLARLFQRHDTIGIDLVAMCSNDILVTGAKPAIFLDYIACGRLDSAKMATIVESISEGCRQAKCALVGGETAEHPDTMEPDDYDLGGFMVGLHERKKIIDGSNVKEGDVVLSLPSSGVHSNGLSLVRRLFLKDGLHLPDSAEERDFLLNEILLRPTFIYEPVLRPLLDAGIPIAGMAHITGGGFYENIPRILPEHLEARIQRKSLTIPGLFETIRQKGKLDEDEMFSVFNMGTGMAVVLPEMDAQKALELLNESIKHLKLQPHGKPAIIGEIVKRSSVSGVSIV